MSIYTIATTNLLKGTVPELANAAADDVIETSGYYAAGDGGAGRFTVRAKTSADTTDDMFTYALGTNLIAELQTPGGIVNVDQLGAKELLGSYQTYEEYLGANVSSMTQVSAYSNAMFTAMAQQQPNGESDLYDNGKIIKAALDKNTIHTIRFSPGKTYGVGREKSGDTQTEKNSILIKRSDITLDGCGATIRGYFDAYPDTNSVIQITQPGTNRLNNVCIQNLHLHSLWRSTGVSHVIRGQYVDNLTIRNVHAENAGYGFRISANCNNLVLEHNRIEKVLTGIQLGNINGGHLTDSYISCDWNLLRGNEGAHGIYAGGQICNFKFERLEILNAGAGKGINRHSTSNLPPISENLVFSDIRIENCAVALFLGERTHNVLVQRVHAKDFSEAGVHFSGVDSVLLVDCIFESTNYETGKGFTTNSSNGENTYIRNVVMRRCSFKTDHCFFAIGNDHKQLGGSMQFEDCCFTISSAVIGYRTAPGTIVGIIESATFANCTFEIENFESNQSSIGLFFYFDHRHQVDMHWNFDACKFVNQGTVTANSPIMIFNNSDTYQTETQHIIVTVRNSIIKGFRWLVRFGTASGVLRHFIDPAFNGYPNTTQRQNAITTLNGLHHVLSSSNYYVDEIIGSTYNSFRKAEEYGL